MALDKLVTILSDRSREAVMTRHIKASELKAKCLGLLDEVARSGETIVITKRGKPVAQLTPAPQPRKAIFGALKGWIEGDIVGPIDVEWEALRDDGPARQPSPDLARGRQVRSRKARASRR
jgi:prevent-host-death family protein